MSQVRILIATTQGPATVQRITAEDPVVNSVVCLAGKAMPLSISASYDAFVRDPTGVIQRHFGHPAYRVDVSHKIDEGYSWQLGLFAAHALHSARRLAGPDEACERTVIATGEVDRDLNVLAVTGNEEKTAVLHADLEDLVRQSRPVTLVVPAHNAEHWRHAFSDLLDQPASCIELLAVDNAHQMLAHLQLSPVRPPARLQPAQPEPARQNRRSWVAAGLVFLIGAAAFTASNSHVPPIRDWGDQVMSVMQKMIVSPGGNETDPETQKPEEAAVQPPPDIPTEPEPAVPAAPAAPPVAVDPPPPVPSPPAPSPAQIPAETLTPTPVVLPLPGEPAAPPEKDILTTVRPPAGIAAPLRIELGELRAPLGFTCAEARQMEIKQQIRPPSLPAAIPLYGKAKDRLCRIDIQATAAASTNYVFGRYLRWTESRPARSEPDKIIDLGPRQGPVSWSTDVPGHLARPAFFRILILSSHAEFEVSDDMRRRLNGLRPGSDALNRVQARLRKTGIKLTIRQFRILPDRSVSPDRQPPPAR